MYLQQIMPHKRLHAQSQKRKQQKVARNISKAKNKDTRTMPLTWLWCLHHHPRPYPTPHANAPISNPENTNVHWAINVREKTPKVKPTEVYQEPSKHSQMYHKRKIIGIQRIQIIIFIIKHFIFRSIPNKRQGSESTSILLEYLKTSIKQQFQYY